MKKRDVGYNPKRQQPKQNKHLKAMDKSVYVFFKTLDRC